MCGHTNGYFEFFDGPCQSQIGLSRGGVLRSLFGCAVPSRYFNSSPKVIRLTVMMYIRYPLSLRQVEDLLFERGINICHETVRF